MTQIEKDMAIWTKTRLKIMDSIIRSNKYTLISGSFVIVATDTNKANLIKKARQAKISRMTVVNSAGDILFENKAQKAYNNR